jgi:alkylhydroperoxidase/carboxymuconolactone decarboxylase family protein YurZ
MSAASIAAWDAIKPKLTKRNRAVFEAIIARGADGATNRELGADLFLERDSVSPRTAELMNFGVLYECGSRNGQTVYHACAALGEAEVLARIEARKRKKVKPVADVQVLAWAENEAGIIVTMKLKKFTPAFAERIQGGSEFSIGIK